MQEIIGYIKLHPTISIIIIAIVVLIFILLYIFRETKAVIEIVGNAIVETEKVCNTEKGQAKLDYAVKEIRARLPKIVSIFITKSVLVSLIEFMLNFIGKAFKVDKKVDIIGNE